MDGNALTGKLDQLQKNVDELYSKANELRVDVNLLKQSQSMSSERQNEAKEELKQFRAVVQGEGQTPGILEEMRNLKRQVKIFGILLSTLVGGDQLGVWSELIRLLSGGSS